MCLFFIGLVVSYVVVLCCGAFDSLRCVCFLVVLRNVCQSCFLLFRCLCLFVCSLVLCVACVCFLNA